MLALAADPAARRRDGPPRRAARAIERFPEDRCTERTEEVYRYWLDARTERGAGARHPRLPAAAGTARTELQAGEQRGRRAARPT